MLYLYKIEAFDYLKWYSIGLQINFSIIVCDLHTLVQLSSASKMSKRERRPNFSDAELRALLSMYVENADILQAKFNNNITIKREMAVWDTIAEAVSALGISRRGVQDVRKKWMDLKSAALQFRSATKHPKTGGGKRPDEPWFVRQVLDVLGEGSALLEGVFGE